MNESGQALTLGDVIAFIRKVWLWAAIAAVAAAGVAYVLSLRLPEVYRSEALMVLENTNPDFRQFGVGAATAPALDNAVYRAAILTPPVLEDARARLVEGGQVDPVPTVGTIRGALSIGTSARGSNNLMTIGASSNDPYEAAAIANAVAYAAVAWDEQRSRRALTELVDTLESRVVVLDDQLATLRLDAEQNSEEIVALEARRASQREQLAFARVISSSAMGRMGLMEVATVAGRPVAPNPVRNAMLAAVLAAALLVLAALLRDLLDSRVKDIDSVVSLTGLPLLAAFPKLDSDSRRAPREAENFLRGNLGFALADVHPKVITVTSAVPTEGKTTVAVGTAMSFARQGYRVLLIDADLRRPMVGNVLGIELGPDDGDWTHAAINGTPLPITQLVVDFTTSSKRYEHMDLHPGTGGTNGAARRRPGLDADDQDDEALIEEINTLDVLPAYRGGERPAERVAAAVRPALVRLADAYDIIVFDSAPMLAVADAMPLVASSSATVFCVSLEVSNRRQVQHALEVARRVGGNVAGVVATHVPASKRSRGGQYGSDYGYGYGYGYGTYGEEAGAVPAAAGKARSSHRGASPA